MKSPKICIQIVKASIGGENLPATAASRLAVRQPDPDASGAPAAAADRHEAEGPQEDLGQDEEGQLGHHPRRQEAGGGVAKRPERRQGQHGLTAPRWVPGQRGVPVRRLDGA